MANSLSTIKHKILAKGLLALREQAIFPRLVNGDYSAEAAEKGDTIDVPLTASQAAYDVTPSTFLSATDHTPSKVQIQLNNWKGSNFYLTDKEMAEVDKNEHFIPMQMSEAVRALANAMNTTLHNEYTGVYGWAGTAGTTPFASTVNGATDSRKILNEQLAPRSDRRAILDYSAEANALALSPFSDAEKIMSAEVKMEGEIGRKFGIDWAADDGVQTHTAGTVASVSISSTTAANSSTVGIKGDGALGTLVVGDIFSIAGNSQTYVVQATSTITSAGVDITINPPLAAIASSAAVVTKKASHTVNLVFHRDAFAFANRPLMASTADMSLGSEMVSMTDPQTGITMRLEIKRQNKRVVWELDVLWGAKLVRPALAMRLAG